MIKRIIITTIALMLMTAAPSSAHFAAIIPSNDIISPSDSKTVSLSLRFVHPFEDTYLNQDRPTSFDVYIRGVKKDLLSTLKNQKAGDGNIWTTSFTVKKPGEHIFSFISAPYFEPSEGLFIVQNAKLYLNALGMSGQWDSPLGTEVEIVPLSRPYGLWTGNIFTGRVLIHGRPAAGQLVEVAYLNSGEASTRVSAPSAPYTMQTILTDANGVFNYAMPHEGWWGFAAITETEKMLTMKGKRYPIEEGGVIWVRTRDIK